MNEITTEYRGHEISWLLASDEWYCGDLELRNPSLSKIKDAINKRYLNLRKASAVKAFMLVKQNNHGGYTLEPVTVVEVLGLDRYSKQRKVAIMRLRDGRQSRTTVDLKDVLLDVPELADGVRKLNKAHAVERAAQLATREANESLQRVTLEDMADLARAAEPGTAGADE